METNDQDRVWTEEQLIALVEGDRVPLLKWALMRLEVTASPAAVTLGLKYLQHDDVLVRRVAALCVADRELDASALDEVRAALDGYDDPETKDTLEQALLRNGDEDAFQRVLRAVSEGREPTSRLESVLAGPLVARLRSALKSLEAPRTEPFHWVFERSATPDELPWYLEEIVPDQRVERRWALTQHAWVDDLSLTEWSTREWSLRLDHLRAIDALTWSHPDAAHESRRRTARTYLPIDPWKKALSAFKSRQWSHVLEETSLVCARIPPLTSAPMSPWFDPALKGLARLRAPSESDARLAMALALGSVRRALYGAIDPETCPLPQLIHWLVSQSSRAARALEPTVQRRWREADEPTQRESERIVDAALRSPHDWRRLPALTLFELLPAATPDPTSIHGITAPIGAGELSALAVILRARPALLRALAPSVLRAPGHALLETVLQLLAERPERWAVAAVTPHVAALLRDERSRGHVLRALFTMGDPTTLGEVFDVTRAEVGNVVDAASLLVELSLCDPAGEARALVVPHTGPLSVRLRCNKCEAMDTHVVASATVHPSLSLCRREGWDGVVFQRVVTCPRCGAEDDYTLGVEQLVLLLEALREGTSARVRRDLPRQEDGARVRRPADVIKHRREATETHPDDAIAWRRLGQALHDAERFDEAIAAWRRALEVSPGEFSAGLHIVAWLEVSGDMAVADAMVTGLLGRWPAGRWDNKLPSENARRVEGWLKALAKRTDGPLSLGCRFEAVEGLPALPFTEGAVSLKRDENFVEHALTDILLDPRLAGLSLVHEASEELTELEKTLDDALNFFPRTVVPQPGSGASGAKASSAQRLGRNDPCHCGSGKKFKKCHGK